MADKLKGLFGGGSNEDEGKDNEPAKDLKGLFGGGSNQDDGNDDEQVKKLKNFAARYKAGDPNEGYDADEAKEQLQHVLKKASPEQLQTAVRKTYENLPDNQRAELAQMIEERKKGQGMVQIQKTGEGGAATTSGAASGGDPLSDLFGGLLGGGSGGGGGILGGLLGGSGGGSLGGMLGGLLGGDSKTTSANNNTTASGGGGLDDLLGSILNGPQGKAILGGIAAFAADAMGNNDKK
jgi:hypothetical protein